jgi:hypothetical protein
MKKAKKILKKKKKTAPFVPDLRKFKLTGAELDRMVFHGLITSAQRNLLEFTSKLREPNKPAAQRFQVSLGYRGDVILNSINRDGGEKFNEPYHFLAEITHELTPRRFKNFMVNNLIPEHPFTK